MEIRIKPDAHIIETLLTDDGDTETTHWLGRELPASAVTRLERIVEIATTQISEAVPSSVVIWDSIQVHTSGGTADLVECDDAEAQATAAGILGAVIEQVSSEPALVIED